MTFLETSEVDSQRKNIKCLYTQQCTYVEDVNLLSKKECQMSLHTAVYMEDVDLLSKKEY